MVSRPECMTSWKTCHFSSQLTRGVSNRGQFICVRYLPNAALLLVRKSRLMVTFLLLKWYYDQKIISFFSADFESAFAKHPTGKILSFVFYPKAVYFECKFWISRSAITHVQNCPLGHQRVGSRENDVIYSLA